MTRQHALYAHRLALQVAELHDEKALGHDRAGDFLAAADEFDTADRWRRIAAELRTIFDQATADDFAQVIARG